MSRILAALFAVAAVGLAGPACAQDGEWRHGSSLFGELRYPPEFAHFDYVNPDAPKGGRLRRAGIGTFDTLNPFNIKGVPAAGSLSIYDTLMASALDEPSSEYGLIAEALSFPDDFSSVTYKLREGAKWHDGQPITVEDVIWSLDIQKKSHPYFNNYYANVVRAEKTGDREVTFHFNEKGNRELPQITGQLSVLPKHWWEATDKSRKPRDFSATTLEPPLGSGPYRIKSVSPGRTITYERVPDYWAEHLPVNVGLNNFDEIQYLYFKDLDIALVGFLGDEYDFRVENSAKRWATGYKAPAVGRGDIVLQEFRTKNAEPMQGFAFNLRRKKFADPRVRQAFNYAFDFESMNASVFFGQYARNDSYFQNTELAATGLPEGEELQILEEIRDLVPPEVFEAEYKNPVGGNPSSLRENWRQANNLLKEAGWVPKDGVLRNVETGEPFQVEFLYAQPDTERVVAPYAQNLRRLGIQATLRLVDVAQYNNRLDHFDFDITTELFQQSLSPGNEQRNFWGSQAADSPASNNTIGIKNPAVDHLIERIIFADDRETLVAATKALDRVLLWNFYVVPQFYAPTIRTARWDRFGLPEVTPDYGFTPSTWWWDADKAAKVGRAR